MIVMKGMNDCKQGSDCDR